MDGVKYICGYALSWFFGILEYHWSLLRLRIYVLLGTPNNNIGYKLYYYIV